MQLNIYMINTTFTRQIRFFLNAPRPTYTFACLSAALPAHRWISRLDIKSDRNAGSKSLKACVQKFANACLMSRRQIIPINKITLTIIEHQMEGYLYEFWY